MSIHTAGRLPPVPVNALAEEGQPPAQHLPGANPPALLVTSLAPSPLQLPQEPDIALPSTEPTLSSNSVRDESPELFSNALRRGDFETTQRVLEQDAYPIGKDIDRPRLLSLLQSETDAETIHHLLKLLEPSASREIAAELYPSIVRCNAVALECLLEAKLVQETPGADNLRASLQCAASKKSPEMLAAAVRLWRRHVPNRSPDRGGLLREIGPHASALRAFSAIGRLDLAENLKVVSDLLLGAIQGHQEEAAKVLIDWLKQSNEFDRCRCLPLTYDFDRLGDDALCLLARAGLPFGLCPDWMPMFEKRERAAEFRAALYGEDLASSSLSQLMADGGMPAGRLFELVLHCWDVGERQGDLHEPADRFIENALYIRGFSEAMAKEFASLLGESSNPLTHLSNSEKFVFYALVNELQASPALAACPDPEAQRQLSAIVSAAQAMIGSLIGSTYALAADLLRCVQPHGKVDLPKLMRLFDRNRGMPKTVLMQLHALLKQSVAQALESPVDLPASLPLRDAQTALHEQLQIRVFRRLLEDMPGSLQSREMTVRANEAELSEKERIAQHAAIEILTQYCEQLAQEPDRDISAVLALVKSADDDDSDDSSYSDA